MIMGNKVWLVTGCSSGFGWELVKLLAEQGTSVIGTVRQANQIEKLESLGSSVKGIVLDVVNQGQIDLARDMIEADYGRLDVLVNNAGYGSLGPLEEIAQDEIQRQFDVNVFGAIRMIKMALPFMRKQKSGHILNVTSIAGLNGFPGMGVYNASKFALEGIGESLAGDLAPLGIKVTNVEPGPFRTDWGGRSATYTDRTIADYSESGHKRMEFISGINGKQQGDPRRGSQAMIDLVELENPPVHLLLGNPAHETQLKKLERFKNEILEFEYVGRPTDFTEDELKEMDR